jgi:hypothetical protein
MKYGMALLLSLGIPALSLARSLDPNAGYCARLDRIVATSSKSEIHAVGLVLLERVGLGRTGDISEEAEIQAGLAPGELRQIAFTWPGVRACAFQKVGETGLPEAVDFLTNLKRADIGEDNSQEIWSAALIALQDARLRRIADPQLRIEFLEAAVAGPRGGRGPVAWWAVNQLCDGGASKSIAIIQRSIRESWSGQRGEDQIRFCEARMQVVSSYPDRVKALASVLSAENGPEDDRLVRWAISQLAGMHTPNADAELNRFALEIGRLPTSSSPQQRFSIFKQEIDHILGSRVN